jgi:hypothetical protein
MNSTSPDMWQEPDPTSPKPIVTGFPIESLPPQKPTRDKKKVSLSTPGAGSASASVANSPAAYTTLKPDASSPPDEPTGTSDPVTASNSRSVSPGVEDRLKIRLKTSLLDVVQRESQIRRSTRVAGQDINYYAKAREALGIPKRKRSSTPSTPSHDEKTVKFETPVAQLPQTPRSSFERLSKTPEQSPKKHKRIKITVYV